MNEKDMNGMAIKVGQNVLLAIELDEDDNPVTQVPALVLSIDGHWVRVSHLNRFGVTVIEDIDRSDLLLTTVR